MSPRPTTTEPLRERSPKLRRIVATVVALIVVGGTWFALGPRETDSGNAEPVGFISLDHITPNRITVPSPPAGPGKDGVTLVTTTGKIAFTSGGCVELDWWDGTEWTALATATYDEANQGIWTEPPLTQAC
ncbi:hypothetical protein MNBD_ACTINO02-639, partial [hydrothermal vent metagenome]